MSKIVNKAYGDVYITDYIFDEVATLLLSRLGSLEETSKICDVILESTELYQITGEDFYASWRTFTNQKPKNSKFLSFTDCTIIAAITSTGIVNLATFDSGFDAIKVIKKVN
jgi:predicted nucleic acid-binding protein